MNNQQKQSDTTTELSEAELIRQQQSNIHGIPPSLLLSTGSLAAGTGSEEMDLKLVILQQQILQQQQQELLARRQAEAHLIASIQQQHLLSRNFGTGLVDPHANTNNDLNVLLASSGLPSGISLEALAQQQRLMAIREAMANQASLPPSFEELAAAQQLQQMQGITKAGPASLNLSQSSLTPAENAAINPKDSVALLSANQASSQTPGGAVQGGKALEPSIDPLHLQKQPFPEKLYYMLEEEEKRGNDIVLSYVADGTAFMIHKPREFEADVMPMYFSSTRMSSFQRQLNLYGFRRVEQGPFRGSYSHEEFRRGQKDSLSKIKRIPIKARKKKND